MLVQGNANEEGKEKMEAIGRGSRQICLVKMPEALQREHKGTFSTMDFSFSSGNGNKPKSYIFQAMEVYVGEKKMESLCLGIEMDGMCKFCTHIANLSRAHI